MMDETKFSNRVSNHGRIWAPGWGAAARGKPKKCPLQATALQFSPQE